MKKLWPIIERELKGLSRSRQTSSLRFSVGLFGILFTLGIAIIDYFEPGPDNLGVIMLGFQTFFMITFSIFAGVFLTSDCIARERREGTLGLLFLTNLKTFHIIVGKIFANSCVAFLSLVAMLPVMSLSLLYGGVDQEMIFKIFIVSINNLLFSLVIGILCSILFQSARKTQVISIVIIGMVHFGLPIIASLIQDKASQLWILNGYTQAGVVGLNWFITQFGGIGGSPDKWFWISQAIVLGLSIVTFLFANFKLSRNWKDTEDKPVSVKKRKSGEVQPAAPSMAELQARAASQPSPKEKAARRDARGGIPLSHYAPLTYIFSSKKPEVLSGIFSLIFCFLFFGFLASSDGLDEPQAGMFGFILFGMIFKFQWTSAVVAILNRERREGTLEFLLSTPVKLKNIHNDMRKAVLHDLRITIIIGALWQTIMLFIIFANGGFDELAPTIAVFGSIVVFFMDLEAVLRGGAWLGLTNKNYSQAFLKSFIWIICLPTWLLFLGFFVLTLFVEITGIFEPLMNDLFRDGIFPMSFSYLFAIAWAYGVIKFSSVWLHKYLRTVASMPLTQKISFKTLDQTLKH